MLNDQYIAILHQYCECRGIKYYDLQTELVDHLANAIEEMQEENPTLGFQELLAKVDAQFGENEFREIALSKRAVIKKKYWDLYKQEIVTYFTFPKACLLILLYSVTYIFRNKIHITNSSDYLIGIFIFYNSFKFISWKKKSGILFGNNLYNSKLPVLSLQMTKWFITKIQVACFVFPFLPNILLLFHLPTLNAIIGFSFFPLIIVALLSSMDIQYKIIFKIKQHYSKAFD